MVKEIKDKNLKADITSKVLHDLPEWFGVQESTKKYIQKSKELPFFAAFCDDLPIGFIMLKNTSPYTLEIHCMGILKKYHRLSYGKKLVHEAEKYAKEKSFKFIQVKTVKEGKYDDYDLTNAFYKSMDYLELEVFETLWDEANPCQIYVKA